MVNRVSKYVEITTFFELLIYTVMKNSKKSLSMRKRQTSYYQKEPNNLQLPNFLKRFVHKLLEIRHMDSLDRTIKVIFFDKKVKE